MQRYWADCHVLILCEGSDSLGEGLTFEFNVNQEIAKNLGCPILVLGNADSRSVEEAIRPAKLGDCSRTAVCSTEEGRVWVISGILCFGQQHNSEAAALTVSSWVTQAVPIDAKPLTEPR